MRGAILPSRRRAAARGSPRPRARESSHKTMATSLARPQAPAFAGLSTGTRRPMAALPAGRDRGGGPARAKAAACQGARCRWRGEDREDKDMIHEAQVNVAGYVATDPKFKKVAGDISSAKLRVAYTARRRDRETGEWSDGPTSFVNVQ